MSDIKGLGKFHLQIQHYKNSTIWLLKERPWISHVEQGKTQRFYFSKDFLLRLLILARRH